MAEDTLKYKQLSISLKSDPSVEVKLYSVYEECDFEPITETDDFVIKGVPAKKDGNNYSEELFEFKKDATGVFEKFRIFEIKTTLLILILTKQMFS